jgi:antitoxin component YwqK of YwqJK toxin-antitoxin module
MAGSLAVIAGARAAEPDLRCPPGTRLWKHGQEGHCETPSGVSEGPLFGLYTNGTLRYFGTSRRGKTHGAWTSWNGNGTVSIEANYEHGELVGAFRRFDANGVLQSEGNHDGTGQMDGLWKRYWPNGRIRTQWTMTHGQQHGPVSTWYESGARKSEGQRKDGRPDGAWSYFAGDGSVTNRCRYEQGHLVEGECGDPAEK